MFHTVQSTPSSQQLYNPTSGWPRECDVESFQPEITRRIGTQSITAATALLRETYQLSPNMTSQILQQQQILPLFQLDLHSATHFGGNTPDEEDESEPGLNDQPRRATATTPNDLLPRRANELLQLFWTTTSP